jgi:TetR/AcrR family transcriptional regulator, tetracycline repressor protein
MATTYDVLLVHGDLVPLYLARQGARVPRPNASVRLCSPFSHAKAWGPRASEALRVLVAYTIAGSQFSPPKYR